MKFSLTDIRLHKLDNGLTLITREDHSTPIVTSMLWYNVGARHEPLGSTGLSHFVEHMLFKGTKRLGKGEIDLITTRNGGHNNAFTGHDYTAYYFSFASDRWEIALEIEADRMANTLFDREEVELERQVILEELAMTLDDPWELMHRAVDQAAFPCHPYGIPVIGRAEDLERMTFEELRTHYKTYYVPNNATLVIVGDFETAEVRKRVQSCFGPLQAATVPEPKAYPAHGRPESNSIDLRKDSSIHRMLLGVPCPSLRCSDLFAYSLLDKAMTEGKLSRLYKRLVEEEGLVSVVHSETEETLEPYLNSIRLEFREDVSPQVVQRIALEELERLRSQPLSEEELQRAKNQCTTEFLGDLETSFDQAFQVGVFHLFGVAGALDNFTELIEKQTAEDVRAVARKSCARDRVLVCHLFPG